MRKWLSIIVAILCLSLCFGTVAETATEPAALEVEFYHADDEVKIEHETYEAYKLLEAACREKGAIYPSR